MNNTAFMNEVAFLVAQQNVDETTVLAQAMRKGVEILYRDALIEAYLLGNISREHVLAELGAGVLAEVELQRDALKRDVEWGLRDDGRNYFQTSRA